MVHRAAPTKAKRLVPGKGSNIILADGGVCFAFYEFDPTTTGVKNASVTFSIGVGVVNQAVQTLTGNGIDSLTITPETTADFGNVATGTTSPVLRFDVKNNEGATTGPLAVSLVGPLFSFSGAPVAGGCTGRTLAAGDSCTISIVFSPLQNGAANATLSVTGNPGGAPTQAITGTGVDPTHLIYNPDRSTSATSSRTRPGTSRSSCSTRRVHRPAGP